MTDVEYNLPARIVKLLRPDHLLRGSLNPFFIDVKSKHGDVRQRGADQNGDRAFGLLSLSQDDKIDDRMGGRVHVDGKTAPAANGQR